MSNSANAPRNVFRSIVAAYSWLLSQLLVLSLVVLIVPVSLQIFSRYTALIPSYIWTEEMARLLFIWTIMIGAMIGVREGSHLVVDVWSGLSPRANAAVSLISRFAILIIALVFLWSGWEFTRFAFNRISEMAEMPLWLIHVAWPLAGFTWIVFLGEQIYDDLRVLCGGARGGEAV